MAVTLREVAERAGVSRSAVSRAFTPGASVSQETRAKVMKAAEELGYRPNFLASALTTGRTRLIGLVADNFRNPLFLEIFDRFTRALQERELRPLLVNLSGETNPAHSVDLLRRYSVDGVVVASSTLPPDFAHAFAEAGLPVVHAFGRAEAPLRVPVVGIDNAACGRMAAETLLARGYRRVAFLGGPQAATSTQDRLAGFLAALRARAGGEVAVSVSFAAGYTHAAGHAEMTRLLAAGPPAEAYFCGDDVVAIGAIGALRAAGFDVPGQVGVIGLNDMEMAGWPEIALTTIAQPIAAITDAAIEEVTARLDRSATAPSARIFPCRLVERATLRPLPAAPGT